MLLTISTSHVPATDLGYLLHKHPGRLQSFPLSFGHVHVFYPEATEQRCTAAMLLDVDPVGLVRGGRRSGGNRFSLDQYVNDRPYVASSFLSVAIAQVFNTALGGRSKDRPELAETPITLEARIAVLPCRGGETLLRELFEPMGYTVTAKRHALDEKFPEWGESRYFTVHLTGRVRVQDLLSHLYVLVPVLDDDKHYWVADEEVEKLLRHGEGWLAAHPARELIARRYLKHQKHYARAALARLAEEDQPDPDAAREEQACEEAAVEERVSLNEQRIGAVMAVLRAAGAKRVLDLGCGEGRLLRAMMEDKSFLDIVGVDVAHRALEIAGDRLRLDRLAPAPSPLKGKGRDEGAYADRQTRDGRRIRLMHGSLTYRDERLAGFDAAVLVEVIEHLDPPRLAALERVVFECARPATVVVTTPNVEYNVKWETLPAGKLRHRDHRFEWTRAEFATWADGVADRFGYTVRTLPVGPEEPTVGSPTQMGVFQK